MIERETVHCPRDGTVMNRHAEKVDLGAPADAADEWKFAVWGGVVMDFYACPRCGALDQRRSPES